MAHEKGSLFSGSMLPRARLEPWVCVRVCPSLSQPKPRGWDLRLEEHQTCVFREASSRWLWLVYSALHPTPGLLKVVMEHMFWEPRHRSPRPPFPSAEMGLQWVSPGQTGKVFDSIISLWFASQESSKTFLVVQWLRIHLPMQGALVWPPVQEDPTCQGATRPLEHKY